MNKYFRKFKKNAKGLSPVVASIILIAVTVAVSVVVAAWMGGMSLGLMGGAEQLAVTNVQFVPESTNPVGAANITVSIRNNGGADAAISKVYINGGTYAGTLSTDTLNKGAITDVDITLDWLPNTSYEIKFTTVKGNNIAYEQVSPAA